MFSGEVIEKMLLRLLMATTLVMMFAITYMAVMVAQRPLPSCGVVHESVEPSHPE